LVQSQRSFFWTSKKSREAVLTPVVEALEALHCVTSTVSDRRVFWNPPHPRILTHAFSNGGSYLLVTLSQMLEERAKPLRSTSPLMTSALILDSCPGSGGLSTTILAFTGLIKNRILRYTAALFVVIIYCLAYISSAIFKNKSSLDYLKQSLQSPHLLPWMDRDSPRLYVFSRNDKLVPWKQVLDHADEAKASGLNVQIKLFDKTPHVAHARVDPENYWAAVEKLWNKAYQAQN
jgi:hypothetical protein